MIKVLIKLCADGTVGFSAAALFQVSKDEQKVKPKYSTGDKVNFAGYNDTLKNETIVQIKGIVFKKYRVIYSCGFNTAIVWIRAKDIIRLTKE